MEKWKEFRNFIQVQLTYVEGDVESFPLSGLCSKKIDAGQSFPK